MTELWLFSYGTLRDPDTQRAVFGRVLAGIPDALAGFRQRMIEITDPSVIAKSGTWWHPMVEPSRDPNDAVSGTLFVLDETDIAHADAYEVDYVRRAVTLRSGRTAYVYGDKPRDGTK